MRALRPSARLSATRQAAVKLPCAVQSRVIAPLVSYNIRRWLLYGGCASWGRLLDANCDQWLLTALISCGGPSAASQRSVCYGTSRASLLAEPLRRSRPSPLPRSRACRRCHRAARPCVWQRRLATPSPCWPPRACQRRRSSWASPPSPGRRLSPSASCSSGEHRRSCVHARRQWASCALRSTSAVKTLRCRPTAPCPCPCPSRAASCSTTPSCVTPRCAGMAPWPPAHTAPRPPLSERPEGGWQRRRTAATAPRCRRRCLLPLPSPHNNRTCWW